VLKEKAQPPKNQKTNQELRAFSCIQLSNRLWSINRCKQYVFWCNLYRERSL